MIHHIKEEWLVELETKLQIVSKKTDRLEKRLKEVLAGVDFFRQKIDTEPIIDISVKNEAPKKPNFLKRLALKLKH